MRTKAHRGIMALIVGSEFNRKSGVRLVLVGDATGLRSMFTTLVEEESDMEIVSVLDARQTMRQLCAELRARRAGVVVLDIDESTNGARPGAGARLARGILENAPGVTAVVLEAMGRRAVVHSAVAVDDVGLTPLFETIRALGRRAQRDGREAHAEARDG